MPDCALFLLMDGGGYVLMEWRPEAEPGGAWVYPGGKVEPGEDPHEAAAREAREEVGVICRVLQEIVMRPDVMGWGGAWRTLPYLCQWGSWSPGPLPSKASIKWTPIETLTVDPRPYIHRIARATLDSLSRVQTG